MTQMAADEESGCDLLQNSVAVFVFIGVHLRHLRPVVHNYRVI